ncbi:hypothetical protein V8C86DRAFT_2885468 [Haematococcus lacustris]
MQKLTQIDEVEEDQGIYRQQSTEQRYSPQPRRLPVETGPSQSRASANSGARHCNNSNVGKGTVTLPLIAKPKKPRNAKALAAVLNMQTVSAQSLALPGVSSQTVGQHATADLGLAISGLPEHSSRVPVPTAAAASPSSRAPGGARFLDVSAQMLTDSPAAPQPAALLAAEAQQPAVAQGQWPGSPARPPFAHLVSVSSLASGAAGTSAAPTAGPEGALGASPMAAGPTSSLDLGPLDLEVPELQVDDGDDLLSLRLLSLPYVMCRAANGDIFSVGLEEVQTMLHKRRLGKPGLAVLRRFEGRSIAKWDEVLWRGRYDAEQERKQAAKWRRAQQDAAGAGGAGSGAGAAGAGPGDSGRTSPGPGGLKQSRSGSLVPPGVMTAEMDAVVRQHFAASMEAVEQHRQYLTAHSARALAELERAQEAAALKARQAAAVDYVVKKLIPEKLVAMAHTRRPTKAPTSPTTSLFMNMKHSLSAGGAGQAAQAPPPAAEEFEGFQQTLHIKGSWGKAAGRVADVYSKMPFMTDWNAAIKKLQKGEDASGWDGLLVGNSVYVKGGAGETQGAAVYVLKCQELGVIASTQVVQQLRLPEACMAHCKLGRRGAQALRHALSTNTAITHLNLADNGLDAVAVVEIIAGLTSGAMAHRPKQRRLVDNKWHKLDFIKAPAHKSSADVSMVPSAVRAALAAGEAASEGAVEAAPAPRPISGTLRSIRRSASRSPTRRQQPAAGQDSAGLAAAPLHSSLAKAPRVVTRSPGPAAPELHLMTSILSRVEVLDLSDNPLGINGAKVVAGLVDPCVTQHQFLTQLRLDRCGIPEAGGLAIFTALAAGNARLKVLSLNNNSLGNVSAAAVGDLLATNLTLEELDLSWNQIKPDGVCALCEGLDANTTLLKLNLAWNGLENDGVVRLGQMLQRNTALKHLDLTNTRMGAEACLMLGEGLKLNSSLEDLVLNGNSLGDDGARHLMSALKTNTCLQYLGLQGSNMTAAARGGQGLPDFNPLAPDGSYSLLLSSPSDRAVALQLSGLDAAAKGDLMRNIKLDGRNVSSNKSQNWPEQLPVSGLLSFDFVTRRTQKVVHVMEHKKFQALVSQLDSRTMSDKERLSLAEVMAPFHYFYCHQVAQVLHCFSMGSELVRCAALLFTRCADLEEGMDTLTAAMQERDVHALHQELGRYIHCRFSNATGHYELDLTTAVGQAFAARLKDVAYAEPSDSNNWHNVVHDLYSHSLKVPFNYGPPEAWKGLIQQKGTLSLDFVSAVLPPPEATPLTEEGFADFLRTVVGVRFNASGAVVAEEGYERADQQVAQLRQGLGFNTYFTAAQVRRLMDCFACGPHRVEVGVATFSRLLDRRNLWTLLYGLRSFEQGLLMWRLGPSTVFDRLHPSGHYILDLANPSHEQVARKLIEIAANNTDTSNFYNLRLQGFKRSMPENRNMWGSFTAERFTPWLEFDFLGPDVPECFMNRSRAEFEALGKGDKVDLLNRLAKRWEMQRIKTMYGYFPADGSGYQPAEWCSGGQLWKALMSKTPWQAAWDRLMRLLVRYDLRSGDISGASYLQDMFDDKASESGELSLEAFEVLLREAGYSRGELHYHYRPLFDAAARPAANQVATPSSPGAAGAEGAEAPGTASSAGAGTAPDTPGEVAGVRAASSSVQPRPSTSLLAGGPDSRPATAGPVLVLHFPSFVEVVMTEPAPELHWKELPAANLAAVAAAARALKGMKKGKK